MRFMLLSGLEYLFLLSVGQIYFGLVTGLDLIQRQVIALSSQIEWKVYKQSPLVVKSSEVFLLLLCLFVRTIVFARLLQTKGSKK